MKKALLLINLGTPRSPRTQDVRSYLREFLSDPRVLTMPALARFFLLNFIILPFRPKKSAAAYQSVWMKEGSPLLVHSEALAKKMTQKISPAWDVFLGMRYGNPSIAEAVKKISAYHYEEVIVLPLFPQYSSAAFGSAVEKFNDEISKLNVIPPVRVIKPFYDHPEFIEACAVVAQEYLREFKPDHVLLSYHGLPESHCTATDISAQHCLKSTCCAKIIAANSACYRAQCFATSRALVERLQLKNYSTAFQSRLGRTPWIKPYTDLIIDDLLKQGVKRLLVLEPSFTADCLETIEEVGIRLKKDWLQKGGEDLLLVPSLNDHPRWIEAVLKITDC